MSICNSRFVYGLESKRAIFVIFNLLELDCSIYLPLIVDM